MTLKEMANAMNGVEYGEEQKRFYGLLKKNNMIAVHGASDDLVEMIGCGDDEFGVYNGAVISLVKHMNFSDEYIFADSNGKNEIEAVWCGEGKPAWSYITNIPHETFNVMEDGEVFCEGIVFSVWDLEG